VNGPGHCADCHAPRNRLGVLSDRHLAGAEGEFVTKRTSHLTAEDLESIARSLISQPPLEQQ
jgi:hypothetical protein